MEDKLDTLRQVVLRVNEKYIVLLQKGVSAVFSTEATDAGNFATSLYSADAQTDEKKSELDVSFIKADALKKGIVALQISTQDIRKMKDEAINATIPEDQERISLELGKVVALSTKNVARMKRELNELKAGIDEFEAKNGNSAEAKMRRNMYCALTRKFKDTLKDYQMAQTSYKKEVRKKFIRQIELTLPDASEEEVSKMVDMDVSPAAVLQMRFAQATHENTINALADIQRKYDDIRLLEKNVTEMHQMFVDIATLIESQGELLDQIEFSVRTAKDYAEKGQQELVAVRSTQRKAKRRMFCISVVLTGIVLFILLFVLISIQR